MVMGKEDMAILHDAGRHIRQVEISNPNGRVYPRDPDEADFASFFRELRRGGYQGGISIHGRPTDFFRVRLSRNDAERPAALGSEAKRNGDGRAQYYFSHSHRVPFRILLFY
jgi:hypothetical protein